MRAAPTTTRAARSPTRQIWGLTLGMAAFAALLLAAIAEEDRPPFVADRWSPIAFVGLIALFALAEVFSVHLHFTRNSHSISLFEIPLTLGLFFAPGWSVIIAHALGASLALRFHRKQPTLKLAFNISQIALGDGVAVIIFGALAGSSGQFDAGSMLAAGAGVLASSLASGGCVAVVVSISEGAWLGSRLATTLTFNAVEAVVSTSLALTGVAVITAYPRTAWLLLIPTVGLYLTNHAYARERRRHQGIEFLHDSTRLLHESAELEAALIQLVDQSRQAYRAGFAQLVYHPEESDTALVVIADGAGVRSTSGSYDELGGLAGRIDAEPLLLQRNEVDAVGADFLDRHGLVDAIVAPLRTEGCRSGVLLIGNRAGEVARFAKSDVALWQTLAVNVATALENGQLEQSLGRLRLLEQRLVHQATHDSLTALPNRLLLVERLDAALAAGEPVGLLFIDLDDFKEVNDSLGHSAGDVLLQAVAERLGAVIPHTATAARHGGDEFAVKLATADELEASIIAQQVLGVLTAPVSIGGTAVPVRASIGIAVAEPGWGSEDLLRNADVAMYSAKSSGKNRVAVFDPTLHEEALRRYQLSVDLDRALRDDELTAHFQPIVELATGRIVAAEALVRWPHPSKGLLAASEFVPIALSSDAIVAIRRAMLEAVCEELATVSDDHEPLPIWVNLSTRDLLDVGLVDEIATELDRRGVGADRLVIEVTEALMIADPDAASRALERIRQLGARIALDDFGTGYSSLSALHRLPVDVLKIAKPFVDDVDGSDASSAFVEAIVRMAQALQLDVVAEGIERPGQAHRLRELGCRLGQGFHFAQAVPGDELRHLVAEQRPMSAGTPRG